MSLRRYLENLGADYRRGNASEHTYRPALKGMLESLFPKVIATNEPRRIKAGAPDFVISEGETPLGYIEAKDLGRSLDDPTPSEKDQKKRYLESLGNLIFTDYIEFRWFVEGEHRLSAKLAELDGTTLKPIEGGEESLTMLLKGFMSVSAPTIKSPAALAKKMATLAQQIRFTILSAFNAEDLTDDKPDPLHEQYAAFREVLLDDLSPEQFADMYAQTITYGLFAARTSPNFTPPFTRYKAAYDIPKTNPFLRTVFRQMVGPDLESSVDWIVDDLVNLLSHAGIAAILADFGKRTRTEDPVVHFYETFLAAYDPKMREARGVYYTPEPIVSYIVRSVDAILKRDFKLPDGLADTSTVKVLNPEASNKKTLKKDVHKVQILDPATGTATFLHAVIDQIHQTVAGNMGGNKGMWSGYVKNHLLPRIHGFELLMAPYTVAHMKLGLQLAEMGYDFASDERLNIYLTNALEEAQQFPSLPLFGAAIARESQEAGRIKQDAPVMVVLGNPPYSVSSANKSEWIQELISDYKKNLNEGKINLDDDFLKFMKFAQWRIEQTGYGIFAYITNHTFLDAITHRRVRESLKETFDEIYVLDLHGNSKRKEQSPDGKPDKNVFDIQQGVAIGIFVRSKTSFTESAINHAELWGTREKKYETLLSSDVTTTHWNLLEEVDRSTCIGTFHFFTPKGFEGIDEYCQSYGLLDIFVLNGSGIESQRDHVAIQFTEGDMKSIISNLSELPSDLFRDRYTPKKDGSDWKVDWAKTDVMSGKGSIERITYRPFDLRWTWYSGKTKGFLARPRSEIMQHLRNQQNFSLLTTRQLRGLLLEIG